MPSSSSPIARPRISRRTAFRPLTATDVVDEGSQTGVALHRLTLDAREIHRLTLQKANLGNTSMIGSHLEGLVLEDATVEACDLSTAHIVTGRLLRVRCEGTRLAGASFRASLLQDVSLTDCQADFAVFDQVKAVRTEFRRCSLRSASFRDADLTGVQFRDCDLTGADFTHASLAGADLRGSRLDGITIGLDQLSGVTVATDQALQICSLIGLIIDDEPGIA